MNLRNRLSFKLVLLALVLLSFVLRLHYEVYEEIFTAKWVNRCQNTTKKVWSIPLPKTLSCLGEDSNKRNSPQQRNDWSKDCIITNTTDVDSSRHSSCLRKLDLSEKIDCDTSCQESIQSYRKLNIRRACNNNSKSLYPSIWDDKGKLKPNARTRFHHLFTIENNKLIFCSIPKSGCTAWKRILLTVNGDISSPSFQTDDIHPFFHKKIRTLGSYKLSEAEKLLKTYKKFLFVREPLERLLSLFLDKALKEGRLPFNESQYENFLKFIIEQPLKLSHLYFASHWAHASHLCMPCDVSYDFIGRLETSERDTQYIFDHFIKKNRDRLMMYHEPDHRTNSSDSDRKKRYYQQVSNDVLRKAVEKYHLDYVLFNYDKPSV